MHRPIVLPAAAPALCLALLCVSGCGGGTDSPSPAANASAAQGSAQSAQSRGANPQAAVVQQFLQAIQEGNQDLARSLLTAQAVQAFDEYNVAFLPTAIDTGTFQIGQTVQSGDTYFVQCIWTDQSTGGQPHSEKIQWMVKLEDGENWRIYGLAYYVEDKGENLIINFEQPQDLARSQQEGPQSAPTGEEQSAPPQQAALPQDPFQSAPR